MPNALTTGFLSNNFPHNPPRLYITAESDDFDDETLQDWLDEGFNVAYLPMIDGGKEYGERLDNLSRTGLGVGETFAIIAYGDAAAFCLEHYRRLASNKLCSLVAYYPTSIPDPTVRLPPTIRVLVHLAGSEVGVNRNQVLLGLHGKRRTLKKRINPGLGTGGTLQIAYPTYTYDNAEPGFAEHDLDEYERVSAELAWTRSLNVVRLAFRRDVNLETVWEKNVQNKFFSSSSAEDRVSGIINTLTTHKTPQVTHTPTLTGGIGAAEIHTFYADFFLWNNPPSMRFRLVSRTIGADRVVDELYIAFQHSQVMPWILPAIPPTNKKVEVIVISVVSIRGGKIYHEHVYWDQASVLLQIGLLNPSLVPEKLKRKGVTRLPVIGREAARRIIGEGDDEAINMLIPEWDGDSEEENTEEEEEAMEEENAEEVEDTRNEENAGKGKNTSKADDVVEEGNAIKEEDTVKKKDESKQEQALEEKNAAQEDDVDKEHETSSEKDTVERTDSTEEDEAEDENEAAKEENAKGQRYERE